MTPSESLRFGRDDAASNILAAEIAAFITQWCYAKITPAALHRGNFANRWRENGEAVGRRLEFRTRRFSRPISSAPRRAAYKPCVIRS
jgi:hypothetical protein